MRIFADEITIVIQVDMIEPSRRKIYLIICFSIQRTIYSKESPPIILVEVKDLNRRDKVAKMNMIIHDDGHTNVITSDGLVSDETIIEENKNLGFKYGTFDFIITNPPYGERLEEKEALPKLYHEIGESFARLDKWSMYLITSYEKAENDIGRKADKNRKIYNGMLKTYFYQFMGPKPPRRNDK